jgi:hypothetical protein
VPPALHRHDGVPTATVACRGTRKVRRTQLTRCASDVRLTQRGLLDRLLDPAGPRRPTPCTAANTLYAVDRRRGPTRRCRTRCGRAPHGGRVDDRGGVGVAVGVDADDVDLPSEHEMRFLRCEGPRSRHRPGCGHRVRTVMRHDPRHLYPGRRRRSRGAHAVIAASASAHADPTGFRHHRSGPADRGGQRWDGDPTRGARPGGDGVIDRLHRGTDAGTGAQHRCPCGTHGGSDRAEAGGRRFHPGAHPARPGSAGACTQVGWAAAGPCGP